MTLPLSDNVRSMGRLQIILGHSADRAQMLHRQSMDDSCLAARPFTGVCNGIPWNLSDFRKLLVT